MVTVKKSAKQRLIEYIVEHGPISTVRVAQVSLGKLTERPQMFWDVVSGQVQILAKAPWHVVLHEPRPRFSTELEAAAHADQIARAEGRLRVSYGPCALTEVECAEIVLGLDSLNKA